MKNSSLILAAGWLLVAAVPTAMARCPQQQEDCAAEIRAVDAMIESDPELAAAQQEIEKRIAAYRLDRPDEWTRALAKDEARFHRSLRRDLWFDQRHTALDRVWVLKRLQGRTADLAAMNIVARRPGGRWISAAGSLSMTARKDGRWLVDMNPVDIDFLGWTCEFSSVGTWRSGKMVLHPAKNETVTITLRHGALWVQHDLDNGFSTFCGGGGSLSGTYFGAKAAPVRRLSIARFEAGGGGLRSGAYVDLPTDSGARAVSLWANPAPTP